MAACHSRLFASRQPSAPPADPLLAPPDPMPGRGCGWSTMTKNDKHPCLEKLTNPTSKCDKSIFRPIQKTHIANAQTHTVNAQTHTAITSTRQHALVVLSPYRIFAAVLEWRQKNIPPHPLPKMGPIRDRLKAGRYF